MTELTRLEQNQLETAESDIERGAGLMVAALHTIRDQRLYRGSYKTFEGYCRERWGMPRQQVNRYIQHGSVLGNLEQYCSKNGEELPEPNAAQARELAKAPPEEQPEVWEEVVASAPPKADGKPKVTAAKVREAVEKKTTSRQSDGQADGFADAASGRAERDGHFKLIDNYIGKIVRLLDDVARVDGGQGSRHAACLAAMEELKADLDKYQEGMQ